MSAASDAIRKFHEAFGVPGEKRLADIARGRRTLHDEEHDETHAALAHLGSCACSECERQSPIRARLEALADELADTLVIAYGTADVFGIDLDRAFAIKMAANMAKLPACSLCHGKGSNPHEILLGRPSAKCTACNGTGNGKPIKRESDGKILKPPGWQKPSMAEAIK